MDFALSEPMIALTTALRAFVDETLIPLEPALLAGGFGAVRERVEAARREVRARGWWMPHLAKAHGGMGLSLVEHGLVSQELGRALLGHLAFHCQAPDAGNMEILLEYATPAQREAYLEPLLRGELRSCFAMTEPEHAGSNPVELGTRAVLDGEHWVLDGHKWFTTAADGAAFAIVMAVTDPDAPPHARASQIIVPMDTPGLELVRNISVMGEPGEGPMSHAELRLTGCRVPADHLLGPRAQGFAIAQRRLGPGRIHHCMRWLGICERAFDLMCERTSRRMIKPGRPLAHTQLVQCWVAESRAEIDAARLMVLRTAWRIEREGARAARADISLIKFYVAGVLQRVLDRAIQAHGALGVTDDTPLAYWFRHERAARLYDGPDEVHKLAAARHLLAPYAPAQEPT